MVFSNKVIVTAITNDFQRPSDQIRTLVNVTF